MFPFQQNISPESSDASPESSSSTPGQLPWQTVSEAQEDAQRRLDAMEQAEPKRRLIRDAKALAKLRQITQVQMAEEVGMPHRTLEEWLQFRRMPKAPGTTLIRRWVETCHSEGL
ncbi:helix-turn-helix transcriptional regulator [Halomonas cerina]|uniref:DNA-binding transcriptional regulator YiaG n=1 Tax=Halomonas cerina TaxID=447424 RepID=A0A839V901_9GAMM|nr:helix-turn-helix transcriptional regulator [Halomonas cerina]MBB3189207.1 DNA-binding transcriptional regulator YiaG [Halomonas cerina]